MSRVSAANMSAVTLLCDEFWAWRLKESPEFATFCGHHEYDHLLDNYSIEAFNNRLEDAKGFFKRCQDLHENTTLSASDKHNLHLLQEDINIYIKGAKYKGYLFTVSYAEGIHVDFEQLTSWMLFNNLEDFTKYVARLGALPGRVKQVEDLLRLAVREGLTHHEKSMEGVMESFAGLDKKPSDTIFLDPFKSVPDTIDKSELSILQTEAVELVESKVQPAFRSLAHYIREEYMRHLRSGEGVSCLQDGRDFYEACLAWHLSLSITPEEVHQRGKEEVARIRTKMEQVIKDVGFEGDFKDFLKHLRSNEKFYFKTKEEMLEGIEDVCQNQIRPELHRLFHKLPKSKMVIEKVPDSRPDAPVGYYLAGTLDGSRPGKYYINLHKLNMLPKYELMTLSLHEGEPGHHFQGMYSIETEGIPRFRQYIEDMNYYAAPSRFPLHTAYLEGWGLYCEYLGEELGLYTDPYSMFGHLSFEMHRACRLVVDTGLHVFGWSYDQAVNLFIEYTALSPSFIHNEVKRYITWPGQACAYKIGELKIKELRKKAEESLGDKFDVRDFHEEVLKCLPVPMTVLETLIDSYIDGAIKQG